MAAPQPAEARRHVPLPHHGAARQQQRRIEAPRRPSGGSQVGPARLPPPSARCPRQRRSLGSPARFSPPSSGRAQPHQGQPRRRGALLCSAASLSPSEPGAPRSPVSQEPRNKKEPSACRVQSLLVPEECSSALQGGLGARVSSLARTESSALGASETRSGGACPGASALFCHVGTSPPPPLRGPPRLSPSLPQSLTSGWLFQAPRHASFSAESGAFFPGAPPTPPRSFQKACQPTRPRQSDGSPSPLSTLRAGAVGGGALVGWLRPDVERSHRPVFCPSWHSCVCV